MSEGQVNWFSRVDWVDDRAQNMWTNALRMGHREAGFNAEVVEEKLVEKKNGDDSS